MSKIQKWASGWNHPSLPGQIFKSRKTLIAAIPEVDDELSPTSQVQGKSKDEETVKAAISLIKSKLEQAEKYMNTQPIKKQPFYVTWAFQDIVKYAKAATDAAEKMEEGWRAKAQEETTAAKSGSNKKTAGQWRPSDFERELDARGDEEDDDFSEYVEEDNYLEEDDDLGGFSEEDDDDKFVPKAEDMVEFEIPGIEENDTDFVLENLYEEIEKSGLTAEHLAIAKEKAMALAMDDKISEEQDEQVKHILRKIDWLERKIGRPVVPQSQVPMA